MKYIFQSNSRATNLLKDTCESMDLFKVSFLLAFNSSDQNLKIQLVKETNLNFTAKLQGMSNFTLKNNYFFLLKIKIYLQPIFFFFFWHTKRIRYILSEPDFKSLPNTQISKTEETGNMVPLP